MASLYSHKLSSSLHPHAPPNISHTQFGSLTYYGTNQNNVKKSIHKNGFFNSYPSFPFVSATVFATLLLYAIILNMTIKRLPKNYACIDGNNTRRRY